MGSSVSNGSDAPSNPTPSDATVSEGDWLDVTGGDHGAPRERGSRVGPYLVLHEIGAGGMGVVYAAHDAKLDRNVALKVLRRELADEGGAVARARLLAEGRALAKVAHPNVVGVFDVGEDTQTQDVYVAMELVDGVTLSRWREQAQPAWPETVAMFAEIAAGLIAVHQAGLVHRDVKPDNILVDAGGRARVTDFGLARLESSPPAPPHASEDAEDPATGADAASLRLTRTGARLGTPAYMASEQLQGQPATEQSDQFAFCVAMWECLYGERPFGGEGWVSLVLAVSEGHLREPPSNTRGRPVPPWLRALVERGLCADPSQRWPNMEALRSALLLGDPHRTRRRALAGFGVLAVATAGAVGLQMQATAREEAAMRQCDTLSRDIDEVWNATHRSAVQTAFTRSSIDNSAQIAANVTALTDAFAARWTELRRETCVAQHRADAAKTPSAASAADVLPRRVDCLHRRLGTLRVMVDRFESPSDAVVSRAQRTAEGLTDLEACADDAQLALRAPLPQDPQRRDQAVALAAALSATGVHEHLGDYDEGLRLSRASLEDAIELDDTPLLATAHYRVAVFEEKLGNYDAATTAWTRAYRLSVLSGHESLAADAASALAFTEGYQLSRYAVGVHWATLAGVHLERLGKTVSLDEARRLDVLAVLLEMQGDFDLSIETHHASLALRRSLVPDTHQSIGYGLANLAGVLQAKDDLDGAADALIEALAIFENAFGPDNPTTAHVLKNLANVHAQRRAYDEAAPLYARVERSWTQNLGTDHPDLATLYNAQGDMLRAQGRLDDARAKYEASLRIHERAESGVRDLARTSIRLGEVHLLAGNPAKAEPHLRAAEAALRGADGHHGLRGQAHEGLARAARAQGRRAQAQASFARARDAFERAESPSSHDLARCAIGLASVGHPPAELPLAQLSADATLAVAVRSEAMAWQARLSSAANVPVPATAELTALLEGATRETQLRVANVLGRRS